MDEANTARPPVTGAEAAQALLDFEAVANDLERRFLLALAEDYVTALAKATR